MRRWRAGAVGGLVLLGCPCVAMAQNTTIVQPVMTGTANVSSAIVGTGVFQSVFAALKTRKGCAIQNNGTHIMWVTVGLGVAASSAEKAMVLNPSDVYHCTDSVVSLTGEIDITGTQDEVFYATQY